MASTQSESRPQPNSKSRAAALNRKVDDIAREMVRSTPAVEGICLFGSMARGDATDWSDVDLLVIGADPELTPSKLLKQLPHRFRNTRMSLLYYTRDDFLQHYNEGALFIAHVHTEGRVLYDKTGLLRDILAEPYWPRPDDWTGGWRWP